MPLRECLRIRREISRNLCFHRHRAAHRCLFPRDIVVFFMNEEQAFSLGVRYFNQRRFFEAHDVWEELWMETSGQQRVFYQGLIQTAIAYYHAENQNPKGAAHLIHRAIEKLELFRPSSEGVNLEQLLPVLHRHAEFFDACLLAGTIALPSDIPLLGEHH